MIELLTSTDAWVALLTLTLLEVVLGIDNLIFISILSGKLPVEQRAKARRLGLGLAVITRIIFLLSIGLIMRMTEPFFSVMGHGFSGRDLVLLLGGLFLVAKATIEIHSKLEGAEHTHRPGMAKAASMGGVIAQILLVDIVFSVDSVITAVGMVQWVEVMVAAVIISVIVMLVFVNTISDFVDRHPTVKMLALAFLVLIGANLVAEGFGHHIPKGYTYFAMAFSIIVEMLNLKMKKSKEPPVQLKHNYPE